MMLTLPILIALAGANSSFHKPHEFNFSVRFVDVRDGSALASFSIDRSGVEIGSETQVEGELRILKLRAPKIVEEQPPTHLKGYEGQKAKLLSAWILNEGTLRDFFSITPTRKDVQSTSLDVRWWHEETQAQSANWQDGQKFHAELAPDQELILKMPLQDKILLAVVKLEPAATKAKP